MKKIYLTLLFFAGLGFVARSQVSIFSENFASVPTMLATGGWTEVNNSSPLGLEIWHDGFNLGTNTLHGVTSDSNFAEVTYQSTDVSGIGDISNWLISPPMTLNNGNLITFFTTSYNNVFYPDRLELRINPLNTTNVGSTTTSVGDFTILAATVNPNLLADTAYYPQDYWGQVTAMVSGLTGATTCRIAFRYWVTNGGGLGTNSSSIGVDSLNVTNGNVITGKLFLDANSNGVQDTTESSVPNKMVAETITSRVGYSGPNGFYGVAVFDTGNFVVTPQALTYYNPVPASHAAYFPGLNLEDSLNDFAYQPIGLFDDLCVNLTPLGMFRAGRNASYMLSFENLGTTTLNGTVIFFPDSNVTFVSSTPVPGSITADSVAWNVGMLAPFQKGNILVTVHVDQNTPIGTIISSDVRIDPVVGDANSACNYGVWDVVVTGSYDPNDILVNRDRIFTTELTNPPFLEYIINFQNTGNDTAFDVRIVNPVDTNRLQLNTLEYAASSHPVNMNYKPLAGNMEFTFFNILLPDSNMDEPASHGFVRYRIKPKSSLLAGDTIRNTASIYFDFNAPVQTNTAITEITLPASIEELTVDGLQFTVYPNPLTNQATVTFSNPKHETFECSLFDLTGRLVETLTTSAGIIVLEKGEKPAGVYLVRLANSKTGEQAHGKIVIGN